jgi:hypothetical protein
MKAMKIQMNQKVMNQRTKTNITAYAKRKLKREASQAKLFSGANENNV